MFFWAPATCLVFSRVSTSRSSAFRRKADGKELQCNKWGFPQRPAQKGEVMNRERGIHSEPILINCLLFSKHYSATGFCFCFGSIPSFFLQLFLHWSPVAYWAPTDMGGSSLMSYLFAFSYCSWGSQGKNTEVVCHSLLQWTTFCQTSPPGR